VKTIKFFAVQLLLLLVFAELGLNLGFYLLKHYPVWQRGEQFGIRDFTIPVHDERIFTLRPGYRNDAYAEGSAHYSLRIGDDGFRAGLTHPSKSSGNVVFIGDSIPFGWGLDGNLTVPSNVQAMLDHDGAKLGVINAAIPSMSMDQAVHRYIYEIAGRYPVDSIVLQTYDPVTQFTIFGREWNPGINWATSPRQSLDDAGLLKYSALYKVWSVIKDKMNSGKPDSTFETLDPDDQVAFGKFRKGIDATLDLLADKARGKVRRIILVPLTVPKASWAQMSRQRQKAITAMNATLKAYAAQHPSFAYVDLDTVFARLPDSQIYRDACCHLTADGAKREAQAIYSALR
jgi:hypothetical protein